MVLAGLGNSVFHPADYAILSAAVDQRRMGRAFSIHTFGGYAGFAVAPPVIVSLATLFGWRLALLLAGMAGLVVTAVLLANSGVLRADADAGRRAAGSGAAAPGWRLLLSGPILMALVFFVMLAISLGGYTSFSVAAIEALYQVDLAAATVPLTVYLVASTLGVLLGGWIADRTRQHHQVVAGCFLLVALFSAAVPLLRPPILLVGVLFACTGAVLGRGRAVARHDGERGHAAGLERQGVRLRDHGLQHRRHRRAAPVRPGARPRQPRQSVLDDRRAQPLDPGRRVRGRPPGRAGGSTGGPVAARG